MKRISFPVMCLCFLLLTGCWGKEVPSPETQQVVIEKIYDTGQFQVAVPELWRVIPVEDPFAQGRPTKTDCVFLRKGGSSDRNASEMPYIRIDYYGPDREEEKQTDDGGVYRNVQDIKPMVLGELVWNGYTADEYHGNRRVGSFAVVWAENGSHKFRAFIWFRSGGETIRLEDRDLQAILAGLEPSAGAVGRS